MEHCKFHLKFQLNRMILGVVSPTFSELQTPWPKLRLHQVNLFGWWLHHLGSCVGLIAYGGSCNRDSHLSPGSFNYPPCWTGSTFNKNVTGSCCMRVFMLTIFVGFRKGPMTPRTLCKYTYNRIRPKYCIWFQELLTGLTCILCFFSNT